MAHRSGRSWSRPACAPIAVAISSPSMRKFHRGVLQVCTGGAGAAYRMPEGIVYLHCVQAAIDQSALRYQVLDANGSVRESLRWPLLAPPERDWWTLEHGDNQAPITVAERKAPERLTGLEYWPAPARQR